MAIYHFSSQVIGRSKGKSSVAAAAYRAGEKLIDDRTGLDHDYTKKSGIVYKEIMSPSNSPNWVNNREQLWNEIEKIEKRKDSQLAREINIALPKELSREEQTALTREFVENTFVSKGMVADICMHDVSNGNPHVHVMLTMRDITRDGFGKKNRDWNNKGLLEEWREQWANHANKALERVGSTERIDHRSLEAQGIDRIPQIHVGVHASSMEKKGIETERGSLNKQIKEFNEKQVVELKEYKELKFKIEEEVKREESKYKYLNSDEKAYIHKAEKIIGEVATHENLTEAIRKLNMTREKEIDKSRALVSKEKELANKINSIEFRLESINQNELELKGLKKNLFGKYKEKEKANCLMNGINTHKEVLSREGYNDPRDLLSLRNELEDIKQEKLIQDKNVSSIDITKEQLQKTVRAIEKQEISEVYQTYYKEFKAAHNWSYGDIKAIKELNEVAGKTLTVKNIMELYSKGREKLKELDKEIERINLTSSRLNKARKAIETIDKNKSIVEKWDKKIFGKAKYQSEHRHEKMQYDRAKDTLKECNVKDKADLIIQERSFNSTIKDTKSRIMDDKENLSYKVSLLERAVKAITKAYQLDKNTRARTKIINKTKSFDIER